MLGRLALAQSDVERCKIRLDWSERMNAKGYAPKSQVTSDHYTLSVNMVSLARQKTAFELFFRYQAPKNLRA